ncbi:MAG: helix-turn-helix domain-containing protein, partial [Actinobacteria bacterium]|nr:helix-turn-helix domain-containing protein [Actinomycetota bacterium]
MAADNTELQCARCARASRDKLIAPPDVPAEFWDTEQFRDAFAARHIGRIFRAYRTHSHHHAVYGPTGISQTLLGEWLGMRQPHISRIENGPPVRQLDTLQHWAGVLRIPAELLWFRLPGDDSPMAVPEPTSGDAQPGSNRGSEYPDDPEHDPVLVAPWNHRGTVRVVVVLSGGARVKRRDFLPLTGLVLTAPAHQWLVHEPEPVLSGLAGRRISADVVERLPALVAELRSMDAAAGGGDVLSLAEFHVRWVSGLLDRASYDDATGRKLHTALAEFAKLVAWNCYDTEQHGLAQRYHVAALRAAHAVDDRPLGAHILGEMAYQTAHQGRPTEAVTLIDTAVAGTRGRQTPRLLAQLSIKRAHACAAMNDTSAATAAISQARTQVEQPATDDDPAYLFWVRPAEITASAGECLLRLGQADQAAELIGQSLSLFDPSFDRDRQYYLTHLAEARARPGKHRDLDAAAAHGIEAIDLAGSVSSPLNVDRIRDLARKLRPHASVPAVRTFLDHTQA